MIESNPSSAYLSELLVGALDKASKTASQLVLEKWDELKPAAEKAAATQLAQNCGRGPKGLRPASSRRVSPASSCRHRCASRRSSPTSWRPHRSRSSPLQRG